MERSMCIWGYISVVVYLHLGVKSWVRMWQMTIVVYYGHGMDLGTIPWRELREMISFLPDLLKSPGVHCKSFFFFLLLWFSQRLPYAAWNACLFMYFVWSYVCVSLPWLTVKLEKPYASCQMNIQKVKFARDVSNAVLKGMVECDLKNNHTKLLHTDWQTELFETIKYITLAFQTNKKSTMYSFIWGQGTITTRARVNARAFSIWIMLSRGCCEMTIRIY